MLLVDPSLIISVPGAVLRMRQGWTVSKGAQDTFVKESETVTGWTVGMGRGFLDESDRFRVGRNRACFADILPVEECPTTGAPHRQIHGLCSPGNL